IACPHTPNELAQARIARRVRAQHQRVDEKPHKIIQRAVRATRDRAADRNVAPRSKPRQQRRKRRLQHHEQARPFPARKTQKPSQRPRRPRLQHQKQAPPSPPRKPQKPSVQLRTKPQLNPAPAIARNRRTRTVKRKPYLLGKPRKPIPPEQQRARKRTLRISLLPQKPLLPKRVIRILHWKRRKLSHPPGATRRIAYRNIPRQRRKRPTVPRNVMQHKKKHVLARPNLKQMRTQRRIALQIKRNPRRSRKRCPKLPFAHPTDRKPNPPRSRRQNHLPRHPLALRKHRAQALVPRNHIPQRSFQRRDIQVTAQPYRQRDRVVRTPTPKTLQKPQPTLRIRQRHFRRARNRTQPRSPNSPLAQPPRK